MTNSYYMENTRILTLFFNIDLAAFEVPYFRGAVLSALGDHPDVAFHNHQGDGYRYAYPLIQYKRIHKRAAIVCLNEATVLIGSLLSKAGSPVAIGDRTAELSVEGVSPQHIRIQTWHTSFRYRLRRWIPCNQKNYAAYQALDGEVERIRFLERMLTAHLMSFLKGVGIWVENTVECTIQSLSEPYKVRNKGVPLMAFDLQFKTNLSLPNYVGIGKNASIGYGIITSVEHQKTE